MTINITAAVTFCFVLFGVWVADLVCYHPGTNLDPTSPVSLTIAQ